MKYHDHTFVGEEVTLDGNEYFGCSFGGCKVSYFGTGVTLAVAHFNNCDFKFGGAAASTITLLRHMYHNGGATMIDRMLRQPLTEEDEG